MNFSVSSSFIYYAIETTSNTMIDARKMKTKVPTVIDDLDAIERPDGTVYIVNTNTTSFEGAILKADCLVFYAEGGVTTEEYSNINTELVEAILQSQPGMYFIYNNVVIIMILCLCN